MNRSDKDIKEFFAGLSQADDQVKIPEFKELYPQKSRFGRRVLLPLSIAASVLFLLGIFFLFDKEQETTETGAVIIVLSEEEESSTQSLNGSGVNDRFLGIPYQFFN